MLVGPVVISVELGREDHGSTSAIAIGREIEPLNDRSNPRTKLDGPVDRILVVKINKKCVSQSLDNHQKYILILKIRNL